MAKKTLAQKREAGLTELVDEYSAIAAVRKKADAEYDKALKPVGRRDAKLRKRIERFAGKHGFSVHEVDAMIGHRVTLATRPAPKKAKLDPAPKEKPEAPKTAMAGTEKPATG